MMKFLHVQYWLLVRYIYISFSSNSKLKPSIYNIRPAPLYPIVQKREIFESENPNVTIKEYDRVHHHHHHHHRYVAI